MNALTRGISLIIGNHELWAYDLMMRQLIFVFVVQGKLSHSSNYTPAFFLLVDPETFCVFYIIL